MNTQNDHFNDLLEVLDFNQLNVMQAQGVTVLLKNKKDKSKSSGFIAYKVIDRLMDMAIERLSKDQDLTLSIVNFDTNK